MEESGTPERIPSGSESTSPGKSPRSSWRPRKQNSWVGPPMTKFPTFVDEVLEMNASKRLWPSAKGLVTYLHLKLSSVDNELIQQRMVAQYQIIKLQKRRRKKKKKKKKQEKKKKHAWMKELRMHASLHQSDTWLTENLDYRPRGRQPIAEGITVTRDIRLEIDTSLPTRKEEVSQGTRKRIK